MPPWLLGPGWVCPTANFSFQRLDEQVNERQKEMEELLPQAPPLRGDKPEVDGQQRSIERRFLDLLEPLEMKRKKLVSSKAKYQLNQDLEDETMSLSKDRMGPLQLLIFCAFSQDLWSLPSSLKVFATVV